MNKEVLMEAQKRFLHDYPGGFNSPEMEEIGKKHKVSKFIAQAQEAFAKDNFEDDDFILSEMNKLVGRSSMVSMFEKPKFRDMVKMLKDEDKARMAGGLFELLHGNEQTGFEQLLYELQKQKLGKWTMMSVFLFYFKPQSEVFVKPTTTKLVIEKLGLNIKYSPTPTWEFYEKYRVYITEMKALLDPSLSPNSAAFSGFLMMSLKEDY
ncbi:MAG: hypothetical protein QNL04_08745 [SAR324 cluster bacterium]|nr:hypothetical protein [SAR324 cluster bacterium]